MKFRRQAKDIGDHHFIWAVMMTPHPGQTNPNAAPWRFSWEVKAKLEEVYGPIPDRLFLYKKDVLIRKRLIQGCEGCDCRQDFHVWGECRDELCCPRPWWWEGEK